jgi:hypothetical protein
MTPPQKEYIEIKKDDLIEFIKSVGFKIEEQISVNTGQHTLEVSGYPNTGDIFLFDYTRSRSHPATPLALQKNEKVIKNAKLRIRQLFLDDSKCELCEKVTEEDGYDGNNEGCEKGLCIECAIHKSLVELSATIRNATLDLLKPALLCFCPHNYGYTGRCLNDKLHCDECIKLWVEESLRTKEQP